MGSLARMIKTVASSGLSYDNNNSLKIFQHELILSTSSSKLGYRVAEENIEETLNIA
jgi:hypothetical protein